MSIEFMMPSNHLTLCRPLLLLPSIVPSIRVFSNESTLLSRWPKYWSFSFSVSACGPLCLQDAWFSAPASISLLILSYLPAATDRIQPSKTPEPVPSTSGSSESAAYPPPPTADDPSALPSPIPSPSSIGSSSCLLTMLWIFFDTCMPAVVLPFPRYCKIKKVLSIFLCLLYYLCEKYYKKPITVQYYIVDVLVGCCWLKNYSQPYVWSYVSFGGDF